MKRLLPILVVSAASILSLDSYATERPFLELGLGVEYGGLGVQFLLPLTKNNVDVYLAAGVFSYSSRTDEGYGFGAGFNYYLAKNHSVNLYYGVLNEESYLNADLEVERVYDYGLSVGYKYYFAERDESGVTLGATFNVYGGDSYPMFSLGYRF